MRTLVLAIAALLVSGCAASQTGPWESTGQALEGAEFRGGTHAGMLDDPEGHLVGRCQSHWSAAGPPHALRLTHKETGEGVTVYCADVRDD